MKESIDENRYSPVNTDMGKMWVYDPQGKLKKETNTMSEDEPDITQIKLSKQAKRLLVMGINYPFPNTFAIIPKDHDPNVLGYFIIAAKNMANLGLISFIGLGKRNDPIYRISPLGEKWITHWIKTLTLHPVLLNRSYNDPATLPIVVFNLEQNGYITEDQKNEYSLTRFGKQCVEIYAKVEEGPTKPKSILKWEYPPQVGTYSETTAKWGLFEFSTVGGSKQRGYSLWICSADQDNRVILSHSSHPTQQEAQAQALPEALKWLTEQRNKLLRETLDQTKTKAIAGHLDALVALTTPDELAARIVKIWSSST